MTGKTAITGLTKEEFESEILEMGQPRYRAGQVMEWIYDKRVNRFSEMTNLPDNLRSELDENYIINALSSVKDDRSSDTTRKYLYQLQDGRYIESVSIPASVGHQVIALTGIHFAYRVRLVVPMDVNFVQVA